VSGFWVVKVDRATGAASTELIPVKEEAWQLALDIGQACPQLFTTVVRQEEAPRR
jgi:hypothetical protein